MLFLAVEQDNHVVGETHVIMEMFALEELVFYVVMMDSQLVVEELLVMLEM
mgnify:CR=1 FL=1